MEDSHTLVAPFGQINGQGFFAVFDGHAGKHAAEWCGQHFHEVLIPSPVIPDHCSSCHLSYIIASGERTQSKSILNDPRYPESDISRS
jgi:Protein phosphatase 2C